MSGWLSMAGGAPIDGCSDGIGSFICRNFDFDQSKACTVSRQRPIEVLQETSTGRMAASRRCFIFLKYSSRAASQREIRRRSGGCDRKTRRILEFLGFRAVPGEKCLYTVAPAGRVRAPLHRKRPVSNPISAMKVLSSLSSAKRRHADCQIVKRKGTVYVICKSNPRFKARQGKTAGTRLSKKGL